MIAVAIDEATDRIAQYVRDETGGIDYPILVDADHVVTELYAISNVPTVIMIDEDDHIVHPNWNAFATDTFRSVTGIDSAAQVDVVRRWVVDGEVALTEDEARGAVGDLSADEEAARLHFRIATRLRDTGDEDGAARNFDRAAELAPHDWTIRRASIPLRGGDPFGDEFFALAAEFQAAGRPYHGIAPPRPTT